MIKFITVKINFTHNKKVMEYTTTMMLEEYEITNDRRRKVINFFKYKFHILLYIFNQIITST